MAQSHRVRLGRGADVVYHDCIGDVIIEGRAHSDEFLRDVEGTHGAPQRFAWDGIVGTCQVEEGDKGFLSLSSSVRDDVLEVKDVGRGAPHPAESPLSFIQDEFRIRG